MPITSEIDWEVGLVIQRLHGVITVEEVVEHVGSLFGAPDFDPAMGILLEVEPGVTSALTSVEITRIVGALRQDLRRRGPGRTAMVATDEADIGMLRVVRDLLREGAREVGVFKNRDEALHWLGR